MLCNRLLLGHRLLCILLLRNRLLLLLRYRLIRLIRISRRRGIRSLSGCIRRSRSLSIRLLYSRLSSGSRSILFESR